MRDLLDAVDGGRWEEARDRAIAAWHDVPDPRLGTLCLTLAEDHLAVDADAKKAWKTETETPGSVDLDVLIATLLPVRRSGTLVDRARLLSLRVPDPRIGAALERVLRAMPFTSNSARGNLGELFDIVARVAEQDPRFARIAETLHDEWNVREAQRAWLFRRFARVSEAIDARWPTAVRIDDPALDEALERLRPAPEPTGIDDDLEARMFAEPWEPSNWVVLRDALLEAGDPRGELMVLQDRDDDHARQNVLIGDHSDEWLGGIGPFVTITGWRDGYPYAGTVQFGQPRDVDAHGTNPVWRTIRDLTLTGYKIGPVLHPFLAHVCDAVTTLRSSSSDTPPLLQPHTWARLQRLELRAPGLPAGESLAQTDMPALRHLQVRTSHPGWLANARWLRGLHTLDIPGCPLRELAALVPVLMDLPDLEWVRTDLGTLERGPDGRLSALRLTRRPLQPHDRAVYINRSLLEAGLARFPDSALTTLVAELDEPELWREPVEDLIARSSRLQHATLPDEERRFDRPLAMDDEELTLPLPTLRYPNRIGAGPAGVFVAQDAGLLRIDPRDNTVLELLETGRVNTLVVGPRGPICCVPKEVICPGRWRNAGFAQSLSLGAPGVLAVGGGELRVIDESGRTTSRITSGTKHISQAVFSPDGSKIAGVGHTRLRIYDTSGGRAKMPFPAPHTHCVAWTPAGIWMAPLREKLLLLQEDGTVLKTIDCKPTSLEAWRGGVVAILGREIAVLDESGTVLKRVPGRDAWPLDDHLLVRNLREAETWFDRVNWP